MVRKKASDIDVQPLPKGAGSRKKKSEGKASARAAARTAPIGDLTDDQRRGLFLPSLAKLERLIATVRSAVSDVTNHRKLMKAEGFEKASVDYALYLRKKKPEDVEARAKAEARAARWLAHPVKYLLAEKDNLKDRTPAVDRAREEGKTAGYGGQQKKPPHDSTSPQGVAWMDGWDEAQATIARGFKPLPKGDEGESERDLRGKRQREREALGMPGADRADAERAESEPVH